METAFFKSINPIASFAAKQLNLAPEEIEVFINEYRDMQVLYRGAIRELSTRLEILDDEFQIKHKRNPIHNIQSRLKTPASMIEKVGRRNISPRINVIQKELTDIAGIRVICCYVNDIYAISKLLCEQDGIKLVRLSDYIKQPKINGYRSLHIVVSVPIHLSDGLHLVPVEIQIRTIAMDFWASLEHELRYKSACKISPELKTELNDCASASAKLDLRMQEVYHKLENI